MAGQAGTQVPHSSNGPSFVSQLPLTQSDSDESFVSRHDQNHQPQIIVSPPSQEFSITNHAPVLMSSPPATRQTRQREARPATPESLDDSTFEDASDSFFDANATPMPLDEDEDEVDPEFHGKQKWQRSTSLEDVKEIISPPRPSYARAQTESCASEMIRPRSHFSIPDVVVTSCEEEGQEMHFEMKVEPTRRKMILHSQMGYEEALKMKEAQRIAQIKTKHTSRAGIFRLKSKPSPIQISTEDVREPMQPWSAPLLPSVSNTEKTSLAKRMRKSSLSSLFGRSQKDKEANSAPPSPSLPAEWQEGARNISPPLDSPNSMQSVETPMATDATSEVSSASTHSPVTPSFEPILQRMPSKKELKAKMKEEKALIKERERIDKLVRKHDKMKQKAASKSSIGKDGNKSMNAEGSMTASSSGSSNESPKKKRATMTDTKRQQKPLYNQRQSQMQIKNSGTNASVRAMKAADFCARHVTPHASQAIPPPPSRPIKSTIRTSTMSGKISTDEVISRMQGKVYVEQSNVKSIMRPNSVVHTASKRRSGTSFKASNGVSSTSQRVSFVRKRQSSKRDVHVEEVAKSVDPGMDDAEEVMVEEEGEATKEESRGIENDPPMIASSKRMTLLESLYKDIEEMEMRFEEEYSITSKRHPLNAVEDNPTSSIAFPISMAEQAIPI